MHDSRNVGKGERWISGALGAAAVVAGVALIYRAASGYCPVYSSLGIDTSEDRGESNPRASVPYGRGVRIEESVAVARPARELYDYWRRLDTLPQFMAHLEEVTSLTQTRSRWRARAPIGSRATWEAEIINDIPGEMIAWRSLPGSSIHHAGSVHFDPGDAATEVRVVLEYAPPARFVGASIARVLGDDPQRQIVADLRRFKAIVERGEPANLQ